MSGINICEQHVFCASAVDSFSAFLSAACGKPFVYNRAMRILAVDPGEKRLGIAISDPTGTLASPRGVLNHKSRLDNALRIIALAEENLVKRIVIGIALNADGEETESSRQARNLAQTIIEHTAIPVETWDESGSTQSAKAVAIEMGVPRNKRRGHLDDAAAAVILQSYLDANRSSIQSANE